MENPKKQKLEIGSSSQSQQTLTPREKFYQDTINMANNQQRPVGWSMKINGQLIYLNDHVPKNLKVNFTIRKKSKLLFYCRNINSIDFP